MGSSACSASVNAGMPPRRWGSAGAGGATAGDAAPGGMTATPPAAPPAPRRMTEPFPNCRSIWAIARSRACRRSFFASAMRISFALAVASILGGARDAVNVRGIRHVPERGAAQLRVARALRRELAPHERHARDADAPEVAARGGLEGPGEGGLAPRHAHAPERHVRREGTGLARKAERRAGRAHPARP